MDYKLNDSGSDIACSDVSVLETFINAHSFDHWLKGSGDSAILINESERLVFWQMKEGYVVIQNPGYVCPLITKKQSHIKTLVHHVGGEPFRLPEVCLCNKEQLLGILKEYINTGALSPEYDWVDMYSVDFDSGY